MAILIWGVAALVVSAAVVLLIAVYRWLGPERPRAKFKGQDTDEAEILIRDRSRFF